MTAHGRRAAKRPNRYRACDIGAPPSDVGVGSTPSVSSSTSAGRPHIGRWAGPRPADRPMARPYFRPIRRPPRDLYAGGVVRDAVRSLWAEPRRRDPPARVWRDWVLVAVLGADGARSRASSATTWSGGRSRSCSASRWRSRSCGGARTRSPRSLIAFGAIIVVDVAARRRRRTTSRSARTRSAFVLAAPLLAVPLGIAAARPCIGLAFIAGHRGPRRSPATSPASSTRCVGIRRSCCFPAALGATVRYRAASRLRELDQVKLREREQLARELHDTVAHHVSAIAIRAQAGRVVAADRTRKPPSRRSRSSRRRRRGRSPRCAPWSAACATATSADARAAARGGRPRAARPERRRPAARRGRAVG